jgi:hypothetical protein
MSTITIAEPFVIGEKPSPLEYQFLDALGAAINLTGFTAKFNYQEQYGAATSANATVSDAVNGKVTYVWTGAEFTTAGRYTAYFWAGNGTNRYASVKVEFTVALPVGPTPNI